MHLHVVTVCFAIPRQSIDKVLLRNRFILISGSKNFSLWMKQSTTSLFALIELLVLVVLSFEPILYVQELQVHFEGMLRDTVFAKDAHKSDLVLDGDCKHFARGRLQLVRTSPMQNCSTKHLHSRESATKCRTCQNSCRHHHASKPLSEQTLLRLYSSHCSLYW